MGKSKDWVVRCRSRKKDEAHRPFEVYVEAFFSNRSKQAIPIAREKMDKKGDKGQSVALSALESVVATGQHQMRNERRVCLVLGSLRLPCGSLAHEQKAALKKADGVSGGKDECQVRLKGRLLIEELLLY